jgi:hypothetical protein
MAARGLTIVFLSHQCFDRSELETFSCAQDTPEQSRCQRANARHLYDMSLIGRRFEHQAHDAAPAQTCCSATPVRCDDARASSVRVGIASAFGKATDAISSARR